jgi:2-polyprenyl-3-methyl-5-hydroxy-6-metoxy-1,4-benzoquinol methylase
MFEEQGHSMQIYDPFYANDPRVFDTTYDFITSTEVAEHLHNPAKEFERLWNCLRPGGYLGIMTKRAVKDRDFFADWHYRLDYTHVTFYTEDTFRWMAQNWGALVTFEGNNVAIFQKKDPLKRSRI